MNPILCIPHTLPEDIEQMNKTFLELTYIPIMFLVFLLNSHSPGQTIPDMVPRAILAPQLDSASAWDSSKDTLH